MHLNGETWLRILIFLCTLIVSASCLRGSELVLQAAKAKQGGTPANGNATQGEVSEDGVVASNSSSADSNLTGIPQIDYILDPNLPRELNGFNLSDYPFYNAMPSDIDFKCDGLHDGFYASVPHHCQVYHHCLYGIRYDFLCANYTAFDQKTFICHFVSEVDCNNSPKYYQRNEALYKAATSAPVVIKTTTTTPKPTTEAPPKKADDDIRRPGPYRHRRPPYRRRPPSYEYYDNGDDYYDDYYYYGPPLRKRPNRNKGYRGDYYGGERSGGHKSINRDPPRRKPLKPLYEEEDEDYEYYYDSADGSRDEDDRRRPLENNYRKPLDRDRPYQNKKREKDNNRFSEGSRKEKRVEEEYLNSRKNDDDKRLRNKYFSKVSGSRSKNYRDEDDFDDHIPRRNQDEKRMKYQKNRASSESPKRTTKLNQKTTPPPFDEEEYDDIIPVTPKWKSRFQANPRRPLKEDSLKKSDYEKDDQDESKEKNSDKATDKKKDDVTESSVSAVSLNPSIYARQPSKLYSQVKVETRPPPVQRNKDLYKSDIPATTMSNYRRPPNMRSGSKQKIAPETERPKPVTKTTTLAPVLDEYEDEDIISDEIDPAKAYYEEDLSDTYLNEQFPSKSAPTIQQPSKNVKDTKIQTDSQTVPEQKSRSSATESRFSSYNQRFKPLSERQSNNFAKQQTTEKQPVAKPPVTENDFIPYSKQPAEESLTQSYLKQPVTEKQQSIPERQPFNSERQSYKPERQPFTPERQSFNSEKQTFVQERQPFNADRQQYNSERQQFNAERQQNNAERQQFNSERQQFAAERPAYSNERQPYIPDRQQYNFAKQTVTERQQPQPQIPYQRQPIVERQTFNYAKQPVTERLIPLQKQSITTERQLIPYAKLPVTDRQVLQYKQVVTERQIIPYLGQTDTERKPIPFPKHPPRTYEITAPGPSGLGGRIEVSDSIPREKYVIQGDRPTGFSLRLQPSDFINPQQPSTQIQRRPEESVPEKIVTRAPYKPVRIYRNKPSPGPQFHDNVRLDTYTQRYLTGTEEYEPIVVPNSRFSVLPHIPQVSNSKEWYW